MRPAAPAGVVLLQRWRFWFGTALHCKLYDFARQCWTDYRGRPISPVPASASASA